MFGPSAGVVSGFSSFPKTRNTRTRENETARKHSRKDRASAKFPEGVFDAAGENVWNARLSAPINSAGKMRNGEENEIVAKRRHGERTRKTINRRTTIGVSDWFRCNRVLLTFRKKKKKKVVTVITWERCCTRRRWPVWRRTRVHERTLRETVIVSKKIKKRQCRHSVVSRRAHRHRDRPSNN